jgi:hypothetical protein
MPRDFFDPSPRQQKVVLIDAAMLRKAEKLIDSWGTATKRALKFHSM